MKAGLIIGGTGAQGSAVVRYLSSQGYELKVITRNHRSKQAKALAVLPNVALVISTPAGYDEDTFALAADGVDFVFVNTDGLSIGEVGETFWGIRFYELSRQASVKHFVYSALDDVYKLSGYSPRFRVSENCAKARVVDFLRSQNTAQMTWSVVSCVPYMEMLYEHFAPNIVDGVAEFQLPLGLGKLALMCLHDFGRLVEHVLSHVQSWNGRILKCATCHASGEEIAESFSTATGRPARYASVPIDDWIEAMFSHHRRGADTPIGLQSFSHIGGTTAEKILLTQTWRDNYEGYWNVWQKVLDGQDYGMLDEILPDRVKSVEEWMRNVGYDGTRKVILKSHHDHLDELKKWEAVPIRGAWSSGDM